jgi:hypothetical protein
MNTKPFWQSTTLWINFAGIVALILNVVIASKMIVDPDIIALIVAILNILNRFRPVEKTDLTLK